MKIVIIEPRTRRYLQSEQIEYTRTFKDAMDFSDIRAAKDFCKDRKISGHAIVAKCERLGIESYLCDV